MAITYTWTVDSMDCYPEWNGKPTVVSRALWVVNGTDGIYNASIQGWQDIPPPNTETFIPYADLTEVEAIGWVQAALGEEQVAKYEAAVAQQLEAQINPPVINPPIPWS